VIHLWPFTSRSMFRIKLWLMERRMVFNRPWNKGARQVKNGACQRV
jgi:hypothetical protein